MVHQVCNAPNWLGSSKIDYLVTRLLVNLFGKKIVQNSSFADPGVESDPIEFEIDPETIRSQKLDQ